MTHGAVAARLVALAFAAAAAGAPALPAAAQATPALVPAVMTGVVFGDANGNRIRDAGEPGLAGVAISNGRTVVRSDADGRYAIEAGTGDIVFAIKPAGYAFDNLGNGLPDFWTAAGEAHGHDFGLRAQVLPPRRGLGLRIVLTADSQVKSPTDVDFYARDIVASLMRDNAIQLLDRAHGFGKGYFLGDAGDLGLTLGDIVNDDLSLYPAVIEATKPLGVPWLYIAGNHDLDGGAPSDEASLATFRKTFGPDTVAWEEPEATFIGLDDIVAMPARRPTYVGGLREDQFAFLEAYLPTVPKDRLLVIGAHIPFFDAAAPGAPPTFRPADRERLFALLRDFPHVLLLSGHTHNQQHFFHDASDGWHGEKPLHEYNVGAACGAFWSGVKDAEGIPDSTMSDGTPNGYAVLTVKAHGEYALAWHNARDAADAQIGLWAPKVLRRGAYPAWGVYANVYMGFEGGGDAGSRVEYRIDGGDWKPMRQVLQPDPRLLAENAKDDTADALRGYDRSPEATPSKHLWRGALATDLATGEHRVEVRYIDPWRGEQRAATGYRLDDAAP